MQPQSTPQHWLIRFLPELSGGLLFLAGIALLIINPTTATLAVGLMTAGIGFFTGSQIRVHMTTPPVIVIQEVAAAAVPSIRL